MKKKHKQLLKKLLSIIFLATGSGFIILAMTDFFSDWLPLENYAYQFIFGIVLLVLGGWLIKNL